MSDERVPHRKQVKHYHDPGHCHELTFSCYERRPLLTNHLWRCLLGEAIDRAAERHQYLLTAFVFMPEHVHLLVYPGPRASGIDELLRAIKRPFSFRIKQLLQLEDHQLWKALTVQQRPGIHSFRFWQEGPGYDRNFDRPGTMLAAVDYIHLNPVRRGLVKQAINWRWSSARWYEGMAYDAAARVPRLEKLPAELLDSTSR